MEMELIHSMAASLSKRSDERRESAGGKRRLEGKTKEHQVDFKFVIRH